MVGEFSCTRTEYIKAYRAMSDVNAGLLAENVVIYSVFSANFHRARRNTGAIIRSAIFSTGRRTNKKASSRMYCVSQVGHITFTL